MTQIHRIRFLAWVISKTPLIAPIALILLLVVFVTEPQPLDSVLNILQAAAILLVLAIVAFLALRDETLRYKTEPESFRYSHYQALLANAAEAAKSSSCVYARYNHQSLVSRSVLGNYNQQQQLIAQHSTVEHVFLNVDLKDAYQLPWYLESDGTTLLRERFNTFSGQDFNGATLSVKDLKLDPSQQTQRIEYQMRVGRYFEYLLTNMIPEATLSGVSIRSWLEPEKSESISSLPTAQAENHLGLSALFYTQDGYVLLGHRHDGNTVFKGEWSPSVSGAANLDTCRVGGVDAYNAKQFFMQEAKEEILNLFPGLLTSEQVKDLRFLGATRELIRMGKPEIFFAHQLSCTLDQMNALCVGKHHSHYGTHYFYGGPNGENQGFLAIHTSQLFANLGFDYQGQAVHFRNPYLGTQPSLIQWLQHRAKLAALGLARLLLTAKPKHHLWRPTIKLPHPKRAGQQYRFVLSESCVVNVLLLQRMLSLKP